MNGGFVLPENARKKLRGAIDAYGGTLAVAGAAGVSAAALWKTITGKTNPTFGFIAAVAATLGMSLDDLAFDDTTRVRELSSAFVALRAVLARTVVSEADERIVAEHSVVVERHLRVMSGGAAPRPTPSRIAADESLVARSRYKEGDWAPEKIKYEVRRRGATMSGLAASHGLSPASFTHVLHRSIERPERIIADFLAIPAHLIWPSRYRPDGSRRIVVRGQRPA